MENIKKKFKKIVKYLNFFIDKILLKHPNKTNNIFIKKIGLSISLFNKCLIGLISILFLYLFYLSVPTLYEKTWVQNTLERKIFDEFKINFSISSEFKYEILPSPHFTFKNVKIYDDNTNSPAELASIKNLKIFVSQKNFFNKDNIKINKVLIDNANFSIQKKDFGYLYSLINMNFSKKKITIKDSNIFYKNYEKETISITKISKLNFFYDDLKALNKIFVKGEIFKLPFELNFEKDIVNQKNSLLIISKKYKIKLLNKSSYKEKYINGLNKLKILNSNFVSRYELKDNTFSFESKKSKFDGSEIIYNGKININPFDFLLNINLKMIKLKDLLNNNSVFFELLKSGNLFNENLAANVHIKSPNIIDSKLFDRLDLFINLNNGLIDIDKTEFTNNKIGFLKITDSSLRLENDKLIFGGDFDFYINDLNNFYNFFHSSKKNRKLINKINFNLDLDLSNNKIKWNSFNIDDKATNKKTMQLLNNLYNGTNSKIDNLIKFKNFINQIFIIHYSG